MMQNNCLSCQSPKTIPLQRATDDVVFVFLQCRVAWRDGFRMSGSVSLDFQAALCCVDMMLHYLLAPPPE